METVNAKAEVRVITSIQLQMPQDTEGKRKNCQDFLNGYRWAVRLGQSLFSLDGAFITKPRLFMGVGE